MYNCIAQKYINEVLDSKIDLSHLNLDFSSFNKDININLYDYQVETLENTCKLLLQYFNFGKEDLINYYYNNLSKDKLEELDIKVNSDNIDILSNNFENNDNKISFSEFINRASFWMATASGKTLIIVKIIELLYNLMKLNEIPDKNILIVAPNLQLIKQFKKHIKIFNSNTGKDFKIEYKPLRMYESCLFSGINPLSPNSITIYYSLTNHISNEDKEVLMDYKNFIDPNGWYIILDEAHKGDIDSTRKQYLNILAKNGFLFNFSATFTEPLDIVTTVKDFKLNEFIKAGYGKNIKVLSDEYRNFNARQERDFNNTEKENTIIKSFLIYTSVKKAREEIILTSDKFNLDINYHNPLMLTISNEINTKNADMKLYFKCLSKLAKHIDKDLLEALKDELIKSLSDDRNYTVGDECLTEKICDIIKGVKHNDILKYVFNSNSPGEIEVSEIGGNNDELAFRLKTSTFSDPFALLKASNVKSWKKNILSNYIFTEATTIDQQGYFSNIHHANNKINILMGSKQFIEGWDSNRPNIINFINMGISDERIKLVLQTIGRGVRVEPYTNNRKRLKLSTRYLEIDHKAIKEIEDYSNIIESLFIFATNKNVIQNILKNLELDRWNAIKGIKKTRISKELFVPIYENSKENNCKYKISKHDYDSINDYLLSNSKKLLLVRDNIKLSTINKIENEIKIEVKDDLKSKDILPIELINSIENYFNQKQKVLKGFIKDERVSITHYRECKINLGTTSKEELLQLEKGIKSIVNKSYSKEQEEVIKIVTAFEKNEVQNNNTLINLINTNNIDLEEIFNNKDVIELFNNYNIKLKKISEHYYNPIIISKDNSNYKHIIKNESEIEFLEALEKYTTNNKIELDWWYFSRIDESKDNIYIPYYDNSTQKYRKFYPDFIFWIKKENTYYIKFIDPKGLSREQNPIDKIEGFEEVFNQISYPSDNGLDIRVELWYYNGDNISNEKLNKYKFYKDSFNKLFYNHDEVLNT